MIVTCGKCDTQFRLDEAKLGPEGLSVRCSICKHVFRVEPPAPAGSEDSLRDPFDQLAQQALDTVSQEVPDVARDLDDAWEASAPGDLPDDAVPELGDPTEESDWGFDEEGFEQEGFGEEDLAAPEPADEAPPSAPPALHGGSGEVPGSPELGSPEEWDFFADDDDAPVERAPLAPQAAALPQAPRSAPVAARAEPPRELLLGRLRPWLGRIGEGLGWTSVAALFLVGLHTGVAPAPAPAGTASAAPLAGGVVAERVVARWVENAVAGPVYVVSGQLRNTGQRAAPAGERVALRLLDATGEPLGLPPVALGPALSVQALREWDPVELLRSQEGGSRRLALTPLRPGERWLFDAVLTDLPEAAARFRFESAPAPEVPDPPPGATPEASPPGSPPSPA